MPRASISFTAFLSKEMKVSAPSQFPSYAIVPSAKSPPVSNSVKPASRAGRFTTTFALLTRRRMACAISADGTLYLETVPRPARRVQVSPVPRHPLSPVPTAQFCFAANRPPSWLERGRSYRRNLHRLPAQPRLAISLICSIDKGLRLLFLNMSNTSEILPVGRTGFISIRPSGSLSTTILSPGRTPRCFKSSLRKVIWPLAVTVSVFIRLDVRQKLLTSKMVGHRTLSLELRPSRRLAEPGAFSFF